MSDALLLRAWEAVSRERHLPGVLEAISNVILPVVRYDSIGIVSFEAGAEGLFAIHLPGIPQREGESAAEFLKRHGMPKVDAPLKPLREMTPQQFEEMKRKAHAGIVFTVSDLFAEESWLDYEFRMAEGGVRAYASVALMVRGDAVGASVYCRAEPRAFTSEELSIISSVARPLAVAVENALANEQIRKLRERLEAENIALKTVLGQAPWFEEIVGNSSGLRHALESVEQVAATDATVLITGETGTGKELIARAIHRRSPRAHGPMVKVNCAAIPEALLASELFGHERGAFTGALERRKGRFEQAHGGTLFLDEVGEMPPDTQVLLLRVLQEREFERVGGSQTVRVDVRIVAATNRDLAEQVRIGRFRSDLYYRLNVFPVHLPALRERPEDIPPLVAHFAQKYGERFGRAVTSIDARSMDALRSHDWPGNVRELENAVERAVIVARNATLTLEAPASREPARSGKLEEGLRGHERETIEAALMASRGRISGANGAARQLGLPASTLEFRIRRLAIDKFRYRGTSSSL
jgi:formate hydrogenlyase transcriptional activator